MKSYTRPLLAIAGVFALIPTSLLIWSLLTLEPQAEAGLRPAAWHPTRVSSIEAPAPDNLADPRAPESEPTREAQPRIEPQLPSQARPRASAPLTQRRARAERLVREQALARAHRIAEEAGIEGDEKALAQVLLEQRSRFEELHAKLTKLPSQDRRQALRTNNRGFRTWYDDKLATSFGAEAAARIQKPFAGADAAQAQE